MFVRMVTATPILTDIMRQQTFETLLGTSWPGYLPVMALNFVIIIISCLFAVFFDKVSMPKNTGREGDWSRFCLDWRYFTVRMWIWRDDLHVHSSMLCWNGRTKKGNGKDPSLVIRSSYFNHFGWNRFFCYSNTRPSVLKQQSKKGNCIIHALYLTLNKQL